VDSAIAAAAWSPRVQTDGAPCGPGRGQKPHRAWVALSSSVNGNIVELARSVEEIPISFQTCLGHCRPDDGILAPGIAEPCLGTDQQRLKGISAARESGRRRMTRSRRRWVIRFHNFRNCADVVVAGVLGRMKHNDQIQRIQIFIKDLPCPLRFASLLRRSNGSTI
jgi:hypothetical protein